MPRYHFHLESSSGPSADIDGREVADDTIAVKEAGSTAGEVLMDELTDGRTKPRVMVTVERTNGTKVAVIKAYAEVETF
ncbi:DUF6894 family protein [Sphingomonas profundi]|uniref:DUF6894 family protein n=1 Tax=Alterirhizorhabdus profundi TaxID=2681549 RepID=UPI003BB04B7A